MKKYKVPITNKRMAALFFALFVLFFILFAYNKYTMNIIASIISLMFALAFRTWDLIREVSNND